MDICLWAALLLSPHISLPFTWKLVNSSKVPSPPTPAPKPVLTAYTFSSLLQLAGFIPFSPFPWWCSSHPLLFGSPNIGFHRKQQCPWIIESGPFSKIPIISLFFPPFPPPSLLSQTNKLKQKANAHICCGWWLTHWLISEVHWIFFICKISPGKNYSARRNGERGSSCLFYFCSALKSCVVFPPFLKERHNASTFSPSITALPLPSSSFAFYYMLWAADPLCQVFVGVQSFLGNML